MCSYRLALSVPNMASFRYNTLSYKQLHYPQYYISYLIYLNIFVNGKMIKSRSGLINQLEWPYDDILVAILPSIELSCTCTLP